jgi:hypothetical protein
MEKAEIRQKRRESSTHGNRHIRKEIHKEERK